MHQKSYGVAGINLNTTVRDKQVPEIERYIHTVKERIRATTSTLPFEQLPHHLIVEIAYNAVFWLKRSSQSIMDQLRIHE